MSEFKTYLCLTDRDGGEVEVEVRVFYDATYQRERISGPPEDCYPACGEMDLTNVEVIHDLPPGFTDGDVVVAAMAADDRLTQEAWDDYHQGGEE